MTISVQDAIIGILTEDPNLDNDTVAEKLQAMIPGCATSAASVASTKSRLRKEGKLAKKEKMNGHAAAFTAPIAAELDLPEETYEERDKRIRNRYSTLERMAYRVAGGHLPSLVVSGPPGMSKSYTIQNVLDLEKGKDNYDLMSGTISAVGLYIALWEQRDGGVVVLDDCDDVFRNETCLNILKAVLDSGDERIVSYRKRAQWLDEEEIPNKFDFRGTVVFCTNLDFEAAIRKGSSLAPHFQALIDRSLYLSLTMRTREDFIVRLRQVGIEERLLEKQGLTAEQADEVMEYVAENADRFYGISIRLLLQIAYCYVDNPEFWKFDIEATKMRTI